MGSKIVQARIDSITGEINTTPGNDSFPGRYKNCVILNIEGVPSDLPPAHVIDHLRRTSFRVTVPDTFLSSPRCGWTYLWSELSVGGTHTEQEATEFTARTGRMRPGYHYCSTHNRVEMDARRCGEAIRNGEMLISGISA